MPSSITFNFNAGIMQIQYKREFSRLWQYNNLMLTLVSGQFCLLQSSSTLWSSHTGTSTSPTAGRFYGTPVFSHFLASFLIELVSSWFGQSFMPLTLWWRVSLVTQSVKLEMSNVACWQHLIMASLLQSAFKFQSSICHIPGI
jgi:hypothetical protein